MIEARHLTKRYGHTVAVNEASFVVRPGRVTVLTSRGALLDSGPAGALVVSGLDAVMIGQTAATYAITLLELATHSATLEEAFFELTRDETDYHAGQLAGASKGI